MISRAMTLLATTAAFHAGVACADLFKCVGKDGKVSYQAEACAEPAGEKRLRTPTGGSSGNGPSEVMKAGWDDEKVRPILSNCVRGGQAMGKRAYAQAGGDLRTLREDDLTQALDKHCSCMMRRITTATTYDEFMTNPTAHMLRVGADAANGGECKLEVPVL